MGSLPPNRGGGGQSRPKARGGFGSLFGGGLKSLMQRHAQQRGQGGQASPGAAPFSPAQIDQGLQSFRGGSGLRQRPQVMLGGNQAPGPQAPMPGSSPQLPAMPPPDQGISMPTQPTMHPNVRPNWRQGRQDPGFSSFGGGWAG
jgi:hypothetical protein